MRLSVIIAITFLFYSCQSKQVQQQNIPKPLQNESPSSYLETKSYRSGDLVESLYQDEVAKDEELKSLEKAIANLRGNLNDSTKDFGKYDS